jgi:hypothetical protein
MNSQITTATSANQPAAPQEVVADAMGEALGKATVTYTYGQ